MSNRTFCDGIRRRDVLRIGAAGFFGAGLSLPQLLAAEAKGRPARDTAVGRCGAPWCRCFRGAGRSATRI